MSWNLGMELITATSWVLTREIVLKGVKKKKKSPDAVAVVLFHHSLFSFKVETVDQTV